ncbi:hypothetical protein IG631_13155 [Alternaria alternata]|nr:hypothetical protein IG631_13155 [Alternaria alternata]
MSAKSSISVVERRRTQLSSSSVYIRVFPYYAVALPVTVRTALPSRRATAILAEAPDLSQTTSPILPKSRRQAFLDPCHLVQTSTEPSPGNTLPKTSEKAMSSEAASTHSTLRIKLGPSAVAVHRYSFP